MDLIIQTKTPKDDMILLEQLLFEIFGKKYTITIQDNATGNEKVLPALVSKNTKVGERPYRFTWFNSDLIPYKHYDIDEKELEDLMTHNTLPERVATKITGYMNSQQGMNVKVKKIDPAASSI
jgi:hypothetical protein